MESGWHPAIPWGPNLYCALPAIWRGGSAANLSEGSAAKRAKPLDAWAGIAAPFWLMAVVVLFGALRPGYSHVGQTISELAEVGTPNSTPVVILAFFVTGALIAEFGYGMMRAFGSGGTLTRAALPIALVGLGWVGAGVFPCGPCRGPDYNTQTTIHLLFATIMEVSIVVSPFMLRKLVRADPRWPAWFPRFLLLDGLATLTVWVLLSVSFGVPVLGEFSGALQRVFFTLFFAWILVLAWPFARGPAAGPQAPTKPPA